MPSRRRRTVRSLSATERLGCELAADEDHSFGASDPRCDEYEVALAAAVDRGLVERTEDDAFVYWRPTSLGLLALRLPPGDLL